MDCCKAPTGVFKDRQMMGRVSRISAGLVLLQRIAVLCVADLPLEACLLTWGNPVGNCSSHQPLLGACVVGGSA